MKFSDAAVNVLPINISDKATQIGEPLEVPVESKTFEKIKKGAKKVYEKVVNFSEKLGELKAGLKDLKNGLIHASLINVNVNITNNNESELENGSHHKK